MPMFLPRNRSTFAALLFTGFACMTYVFTVSADPSETIPNGRGIGIRELHGNNGNGNVRVQSGNGISYHGGPVVTSGSHVYYIWYGDWSKTQAQSILPDLAINLNGSPYFNINTTYKDGKNNPVQNTVVLSGQCVSGLAKGTSLADADLQAIVADALTPGGQCAVVGGGGNFGWEANGIYFVLTAPGVKETSGFCTKYCGWHTHFTWNGNDVKYAFVGDADNQCASSCQEYTSNTPNGDAGADGMASVIAHELEEATTDPDLNAWYDTKGQENADKCAWTFGTTKSTATGAVYNVTLGIRNWLIQQNWVNANGGYCSMSY